MNRFAQLLDRLAYEPRRLAKLALMEDYFRTTPDPDRGWALAALTGALNFREAKPALIRKLAEENADPTLFALSYDFVGDLAETVALIWRPRPGAATAQAPTLSEIVDTLSRTGKAALPAQIADWLDRLDETGRWALLKLITGGLRVGASARLARTALQRLGPHALEEIEDVWPALAPPYAPLFAWLEGGERPRAQSAARFHAPMLAHAFDMEEAAKLDPKDFRAEWKWDGIRVQAAAGDGVGRLFSRTGEDISASFPELAARFDFNAVLDGELLIVREGRVQSFNDLQQRLNRKTINDKLIADYPAFIRLYDILSLDGEDLRPLPLLARRRALERFVGARAPRMMDISPLLSFDNWEALDHARRAPDAGPDSAAIEGVMIKRADAPYVAGRPKGLWWKWKRDPFAVDAVLMYAQRGHGKRSSFYSDYTFGVWRDGALVPVGKAYFGFTDEELREIDRFVRNNTVSRFGPVREVAHEAEKGLVFEVAFEGLQRSPRHKSGLAMRFPRIARIRWDKSPKDADEISALEQLLK